MIKPLIAIAALTAACTSTTGQDSRPTIARAKASDAATVTVGTTVTIRSGFERLPLVEPHISAHPSDDDHLLVAAMVVTDISNAYETSRLSSFVSEDGGATWTETPHDWWGYDPWTAILPDGRAVMSWIGTYGRFSHRFPIRLFSSADAGATWRPEVQTLEGNHDGTKLVAAADGCYFTTVHFRSGMSADVVLYRQRGLGPFEQVARIDSHGERLNFCEPAVLTDGTVLVPASRPRREVWVQAFTGSGELSERRVVSNRPGVGRGYMRMVADTSESSEFADRVYFVRALGRAHGGGVWLNRSTDGGLTWSADTRIDLFEDAKPSRANVPSAAVNRAGVLGVSWVDSQNDPARNDVYFTASLDGGESFVRPARVTEVGSDPRTDGNGDVANKFHGGGHYLGLTAKPDGRFQLIWSDSRSGHFELQTCNVAVETATRRDT